MIDQNNLGEYKLAGILLTVCLLMLVVVLIEWHQFASYESSKQSDQSVTGKNTSRFEDVPPPVKVLLDREEYQEITQRPLFFQGRRPLAEGADRLDSYKGELDLVLTGVIVTPEGLSALLKDSKNRSQHLKLEEEIDGWVLNAVYAHKIILTKDGKRKTILLRVPRKNKKDKPGQGKQRIIPKAQVKPKQPE